MFWSIVLFIVIVVGGFFLRAVGAGFSQYVSKVGKNEFDTGGVIFISLFSIMINFGVMFYIAFAVRWSLIFLLDYTMSYWIVVGLLYAYSHLLKPLNIKED